MERVKLEKKKTGKHLFKPGHRFSVGNNGPKARLEKRFYSTTLRRLFESIDPLTNRFCVHEVCDNIYKVASSFEHPQAMTAARLALEMLEGKAPQEVNLNAKVATIGATVTPAQAARLFQDTLTEEPESE